ncbi:chromosome partitioning protein [Bradyrhizobium liaoningense]|uniref:chromosome partitioning protein n=1 Tax=Bradyrhizobium liaoningense TaxID=43992 RepID=UPI001BA8E740|nr:chromosome partitioning protein [Bradyrhizobium liaoningense]MBR1030323.1 chromosome partitioning protein [Bradyrhizobium liaoningense]
MPRITIIGSETGGVGKSTVARGIAEAVPDAPIIEVESSPRIIEYDHGRAKGPKRVAHFPVRADRALVERSGGQAARAEFDVVINAVMDSKLPTIIDIGANAALSFLDTFDEEMISAFAENNVELALVVVVTADASSLSAAAKLVAAAKAWAAATFVIDNRVRGNIDQAIVKRLADGATVTTLTKAEFEPHTMRFLQAMGLAAIPSLKASDLQAEYGFAQARRMVADLKAFRLAVMEAVRPAATWLVT